MKIAVIPAYNEEATIGEVVAMSKMYVDKVIVLDDGSCDGTPLVAFKAGAIVHRHDVNLGKGAALKSGFYKALTTGAEIIVTLDADLQHDPNEIPLLLKPIERGGYDVVVGQRTGIEDMPLIRRISNYLSTKILEIFFNLRLDDSQCGFRAFRRTVLEAISFKNQRYSAESEILIDAHKKGFKIIQIPVCYKPSRKKKGKYWKPLIDTLQFLSVFIHKFIEK